MNKVRALALLARGVIGLLAATVRLREHGREKSLELASAGERLVYPAWHDRLLFTVYSRRGEGVMAMASRSKDGDLAAGIIETLGFVAVRGSTGKGGREALDVMVDGVRAGRSAALTVDGPRGPRHEVKPGVLHLAQRADAWLVPISYQATRYWTLRSWDRFLIPKPFSRVTVCYGEPFKVAPDADLAQVRTFLAEKLDELEQPLPRKS